MKVPAKNKDKKMITLYQFPRMFDIPNMSPFCLKLETFLRMAELSYDIVEVNDPRSAPLGKLPYIQDGDKTLPDSQLIIEYLTNEYGIMLDSHLSSEEKAIAHSFNMMMGEHYYWALLYSRWVDDNWEKVKAEFFGQLPPLVKTFVPVMIQKQMKSNLEAQGTGRLEPHALYELANQDIKAVAAYLGDKSFFMGDRPSSIDATLFAFTANVLLPDLPGPLKACLQRYENLVAYTHRMMALYYAEFLA